MIACVQLGWEELVVHELPPVGCSSSSSVPFAVAQPAPLSSGSVWLPQAASFVGMTFTGVSPQSKRPLKVPTCINHPSVTAPPFSSSRACLVNRAVATRVSHPACAARVLPYVLCRLHAGPPARTTDARRVAYLHE